MNVLESLKSQPLTIDKMARLVKLQADHLFPNRTDASMFMKLFSEIGELADRPDDPEEVADVFIMLLDYAARRRINIQEAVLKKMIINDCRNWQVNELGVMKHVD